MKPFWVSCNFDRQKWMSIFEIEYRLDTISLAAAHLKHMSGAQVD